MTTEKILEMLRDERDKISRAIHALSSSEVREPQIEPGAVTVPNLEAPKKRTVSAAARRKMAEGQKRRWAAKNGATVIEVTTSSKKAAAPKKAPAKRKAD